MYSVISYSFRIRHLVYKKKWSYWGEGGRYQAWHYSFLALSSKQSRKPLSQMLWKKRNCLTSKMSMLTVCAGTENKEVQKHRNLHFTTGAVLTFLNIHFFFFLNKKYTHGHFVFFLLCTFSSHLNSIFKVQCSCLFSVINLSFRSQHQVRLSCCFQCQKNNFSLPCKQQFFWCAKWFKQQLSPTCHPMISSE